MGIKESTVKPGTHYPYIRPVYTGSVYGAFVPHSVTSIQRIVVVHSQQHWTTTTTTLLLLQPFYGSLDFVRGLPAGSAGTRKVKSNMVKPIWIC